MATDRLDEIEAELPRWWCLEVELDRALILMSMEWLIAELRAARERIRTHRNALAEYEKQAEALRRMLIQAESEAETAEATAASLQAENKLHRQKAAGEYWAWQGDGEDHLESLTCPVLVPAQELARFQAERDELLAIVTIIDKEGFGWMRWGRIRDMARAAIAKVEGAKPC